MFTSVENKVYNQWQIQNGSEEGVGLTPYWPKAS